MEEPAEYKTALSGKKKEYHDELLKVIKEKKIAFIDHAIAYISFSEKTLYNHELQKLQSIKEAIKQNRVSAKNYMLNKWIGSSNPTLQISAMRLLSTSEEHKKLNQSYVDHTTKDKPIEKIERVIISQDENKDS